MIKNNERIKGYKTKKNNIIKIQSYADDTTIIIRNPNKLKEIEKEYEKQSKASESKLNVDKTQILKLGNSHFNEPDNFKNKIKAKV